MTKRKPRFETRSQNTTARTEDPAAAHRNRVRNSPTDNPRSRIIPQSRVVLTFNFRGDSRAVAFRTDVPIKVPLGIHIHSERDHLVGCTKSPNIYGSGTRSPELISRHN